VYDWLSEDGAEAPVRVSGPTGFNAAPSFILAYPSTEHSVNAAAPIVQTHQNLGAIVIDKAYYFSHLNNLGAVPSRYAHARPGIAVGKRAGAEHGIQPPPQAVW
jgi:hypothetical protein